jgi:hypothetical protein
VRLDQRALRSLPQRLLGDHHEHDVYRLGVPALIGQPPPRCLQRVKSQLPQLLPSQQQPGLIPSWQQLTIAGHQMCPLARTVALIGEQPLRVPSILVNIDGDVVCKHHPVVLTMDERGALTTDAPQCGPEAGTRSLCRRVRPQPLGKDAAVAVFFGGLVEAQVGQHPPRMFRQRDATAVDADAETAE